MEVTYPIMLGDIAVGEAKVGKEGLYYHIFCVCRLPKNGKYMIIACSNDKRQNLGICVPQADGFGLAARLPIKRIGEGDLAFQAVSKDTEIQGEFYPVHSQKPFFHISQLERARFTMQNGQAGIVLGSESQSSNSKPTGQ